MSYSYKDVIGRQRVFPIPDIFLYPRGKYPQFHIWVVDPYSYTEDILISDLILDFMISDNFKLKINYIGMTLWYSYMESVWLMLA